MSTATAKPGTSLLGAHLDLTTVLGALDCLRMLDATRDHPITIDLLLTLSQFLEDLVIHEFLYYEDDRSENLAPYVDLVDESRFTDFISRSDRAKLLIGQPNIVQDEATTIEALRWGVGKVRDIDLRILRCAVETRKSAFRAVTKVTGKPDTQSPFLRAQLRLVEKCGDAHLQTQVQAACTYLDSTGIGALGLHVLVRLFLLQRWMACRQDVVYAPHFSRAPMTQMLLSRRSPCHSFRRWSVGEMQNARQRILAEYLSPKEQAKWTLELSPIFLACLPGARTPLEVLENALTLRDTARSFRVECQSLGESGGYSEPQEMQLRHELRKCMTGLDDLLRSKVSRIRPRSELSIGLSGPRISFRVEEITVSPTRSPSVMFLRSVVRTSLVILDALPYVERIFGPVEDVDTWILE